MMTSAARTFFAEQARWDESHSAGILEFLRDADGDANRAYREFKAALEDPDYFEDWRDQNHEEIEEHGCTAREAFETWKDAILRISKDRLYQQNPTSPTLTDDERDALQKYLDFHRYGAKNLDTVDIRIPTHVYKAGKGIEVRYRSGKVDPSTLRKPRRPVDYIHEFNAGVAIYRADAGDGRARTEVPEKFRDVGALVKLGTCLGFSYKNEDGVTEGNASRPMPELACSPDGTCLYIIQGRSRVIAMIWGGALGVFPRGIDG